MAVLPTVVSVTLALTSAAAPLRFIPSSEVASHEGAGGLPDDSADVSAAMGGGARSGGELVGGARGVFPSSPLRNKSFCFSLFNL